MAIHARVDLLSINHDDIQNQSAKLGSPQDLLSTQSGGSSPGALQYAINVSIWGAMLRNGAFHLAIDRFAYCSIGRVSLLLVHINGFLASKFYENHS
jgi:hypothetical protein